MPELLSRPIQTTPVHLLDQGMVGWFGIVIPEGTTNLVDNPSFESNSTTNWNAHATGTATGTRTLATDRAYKGRYSYKLTKSGGGASDEYGTNYILASPLSGWSYTFSVYAYCPSGSGIMKVEGNIGPGGALVSISIPIRDAQWKRYVVTVYCENSAQVRLYVIVNSATGIIYMDAAQIEQKPYETTYCDKDQEDCAPIDTYSAITTSKRSDYTRKGGRIVNLKQFSFTVRAIVGLGMSAIQVVDTAFALDGGGYYQRSVAQIRQFTIAGSFDCDSFPALSQARQGMIDAFTPDAVVGQQKIRLYYQPYQDRAMTEPVYIDCVYAGGLEGNITNFNTEVIALNFKAYLPHIVAVSERPRTYSVNLPVSISPSSARNVIRRDAAGKWSALGAADPNEPAGAKEIVAASNGDVYVVTGTDQYLYRWTATAGSWSKTSLGSAGVVNSIAEGFDSLRLIYWGGTVTGGTSDRAGSYNPSTLGVAKLGAAVPDNTVTVVRTAPDGKIWFAGQFSNVGALNTGGIATWDGTAWAEGSNPHYTGLFSDATFDEAGKTFYLIGPKAVLRVDTATKVPTLDTSTPEYNGASSPDVYQIARGPDGMIYLAGAFTTVNGIASPGLAAWNGRAWQPSRAALDTTSPLTAPTIYAMEWTPYGLVLAGNNIKIKNYQTLGLDGFLWDGAAWAALDFDMTGGAVPKCVAYGPDGTLYVGTDVSPTAVNAPQATLITNDSVSASPMRFLITGPGRLLQLRNPITRSQINLDFTLLAGETIYLKTGPDWSAVSDKRGDVSQYILPGSDLATMLLLPGRNYISAFMLNTSGASTVTLETSNTFNSIDGVFSK